MKRSHVVLGLAATSAFAFALVAGSASARPELDLGGKDGGHDLVMGKDGGHDLATGKDGGHDLATGKDGGHDLAFDLGGKDGGHDLALDLGGKDGGH